MLPGKHTQIKLASEVQGTLAMANLPASDTYGEIAATQIYAGNPNGHVAGNAANGTTPPSLCWDTTDSVLWVCTTTGAASAAVWTNSAAATVAAETNRAEAAESTKAPLNSPDLTGTPTVPTAAAGTNTAIRN